MTPQLISERYRQANAAEHRGNPLYGSHGHRWADKIRELVNQYKFKSALDYGCGKGTLAAVMSRETDIQIKEYDPAIPGKSADPEVADLVICTDVLEHIEPDYLDEVLRHIFSKMNKAAFFCIAMRKGSKLPDGTQKHQLLKKTSWWIKKLSKYGKVKVLPSLRTQELTCLVSKKVKRWDVILNLASANKWKSGAEVGVFRGQCLSKLLNSGLRMIAVDLWADLPVDEREKSMEFGHTNYHRHPLAEYEAEVRKIASMFGDRCTILKKDTVEAAQIIPDGILDFVFIDACHETEAVKADIRAWLPKLREGGYMMGHDRSWPSVQKALDELCPGYETGADSVWYIAKERVNA